MSDDITANNDLCVKNSAGTSVCITGDQLAALLSQSADVSFANPTPGDATATPPVIQINGDNPAIIQVGTAYNDLGATITGPQADLNLGITTYVNGIETSPVQIDTSTVATDTIDYVATDSAGVIATSTRTVIIQAANDNQASSTPANDNTPPLSATSTTATSSAQ